MKDRTNYLTARAWKHRLREGGPEAELRPDEGIVSWIPDAGAKAVGDGDTRDVEMTYSSSAVDRDGDTIKQSGIELANYRKNPVVLYAHGYGESTLPIARSIKLFRDGDLSKSVDRFVDQDIGHIGQLAETVLRLLTHKERFLRAASIGFRPRKFEFVDEEKDQDRTSEYFYPIDYTKIEKLEHSVVPIPANPEALRGAKQAGINIGPIKQWAEAVLDDGMSLILPRKLVEQAYKEANGNARSFYVGILGKKAKHETAGLSYAIPENVSEDLAPVEDPWLSPSPNALGWDESEPLKAAGYFALIDTGKADFGYDDLKYCHHRSSDGAAVFRGVVGAMFRALQDGCNLQTWEHLADHYRAFDREPPEHRSWQPGELMKRIAEDYSFADEGGEPVDYEKLAEKLVEAMGKASAPAPKIEPPPAEALAEQMKALQTSIDGLSKLFATLVDEKQPSSPSSGDEIVIRLAPDEKKDEEKEVEAFAKFLAEEASKAVDAALEQASGRLPN